LRQPAKEVYMPPLRKWRQTKVGGPNAKPRTVKHKLKSTMKKISIACLISGMLSVLIGVAIKNSAGSHSLLIMGLLLEAIALVLFLIILFRK
jgi:hypothetical protein